MDGGLALEFGEDGGQDGLEVSGGGDAERGGRLGERTGRAQQGTAEEDGKGEEEWGEAFAGAGREAG